MCLFRTLRSLVHATHDSRCDPKRLSIQERRLNAEHTGTKAFTPGKTPWGGRGLHENTNNTLANNGYGMSLKRTHLQIPNRVTSGENGTCW